MAMPFYQVQELIQQHDVAVFSSNYALYAEMSRRFNNTIQQFVSAKDIEIYSIDETFIELSSYSQTDLNEWAQEIKATLWQWLALPVCVGIGHSKTEAKLANHLAKKNSYFNGVCVIYSIWTYVAKKPYFNTLMSLKSGVWVENLPKNCML